LHGQLFKTLLSVAHHQRYVIYMLKYLDLVAGNPTKKSVYAASADNYPWYHSQSPYADPNYAPELEDGA
jgi:hypothetical protein